MHHFHPSVSFQTDEFIAFRVQDTHNRRQVEINRLHGHADLDGSITNLWGRGYVVLNSGAVGRKVASNVLLHLSQVPSDVLASLQADTRRVVQDALTPAGSPA